VGIKLLAPVFPPSPQIFALVHFISFWLQPQPGPQNVAGGRTHPKPSSQNDDEESPVQLGLGSGRNNDKFSLRGISLPKIFSFCMALQRRNRSSFVDSFQDTLFLQKIHISKPR